MRIEVGGRRGTVADIDESGWMRVVMDAIAQHCLARDKPIPFSGYSAFASGVRALSVVERLAELDHP
jgi:hypothetical protein